MCLVLLSSRTFYCIGLRRLNSSVHTPRTLYQLSGLPPVSARSPSDGRLHGGGAQSPAVASPSAVCVTESSPPISVSQSSPAPCPPQPHQGTPSPPPLKQREPRNPIGVQTVGVTALTHTHLPVTLSPSTCQLLSLPLPARPSRHPDPRVLTSLGSFPVSGLSHPDGGCTMWILHTPHPWCPPRSGLPPPLCPLAPGLQPQTWSSMSLSFPRILPRKGRTQAPHCLS